MKIRMMTSGVVDFNPSIDISSFSSLQLLRCSLYNSWYNITDANNKLRYHNGEEWLDKFIVPGNYNIDSLTDAIDMPAIAFYKIKPSGKVMLRLDEGWRVDFSKKRSFRDLLGWLPVVVSGPATVSTKSAAFNTVDKYMIHCDMVQGSSGDGSYVGGSPSDCLEILPVRGTQELAQEVVYDNIKPISVPLRQIGWMNQLKVWVTDQNNQPIDFHDYRSTFVIEIL